MRSVMILGVTFLLTGCFRSTSHVLPEMKAVDLHGDQWIHIRVDGVEIEYKFRDGSTIFNGHIPGDN